MRKMHWALSSIGVLVIASGTSIVACASNAENCEKTDQCGQVSTGTGTGTGGDDSACVPSPNTDPGDECGTFVSESSGDDMNPGSKLSPVKTFAKALEVASASSGTKRIYACAEEFPEAIEVPAGIEIYGGLDCEASWKYTGETAKTTLKPEPDKVPLMLKGGEGKTVIADVVALASDAKLPGGSSIAAIADGATVDFLRCELSAGNGMAGDKGATPADPAGPANADDAAIRGNSGTAACTSGTTDNLGGAAKTNESCTMSIGGAGGVGKVDAGGNGVDGQPLPADNPDGWGIGGKGGGATGCKNGEQGLIGVDGASGEGGTTIGTISSSGFAGNAGKDGAPGTAGQGGGGGGGAKGKTGCAGAGGGSGGAGGCGGGGGKGGQAGGASVALISLNATLTFADVTLNAAAGGKGGEGGDGQDGGIGGTGGNGVLGSGTPASCTGGQGGQGGLGGKGGGGRGGHSLGIAFTGTAPTTAGATINTGTVGEGGLGTNMISGTEGQPGVKGETQAFEM